MLFLGVIFIVGYVNIYLMVPAFIMVIIFYYLRVFYLPTSRGIKKLEGVSKYIFQIINNINTIKYVKIQFQFILL